MAEDPRRHLRIGELSELLGVKVHVLRYWEEEIPALRPKKTRGAHRHYSPEDVALARSIKTWVVDQGYSVQGARRKLEGGDLSRDPVRDDLERARDELRALLDMLGPDPEGSDEDANEVAADSRLQSRRQAVSSRPLR